MEGRYLETPHGVVAEMSKSVAHEPLPPCAAQFLNGKPSITLVLFYQYVEPSWNEKEHKAAIKFVNALAKEHNICGRGRCAREGLNCSLTGSPLGVRAFCVGLRAWNSLFEETDFKLTDGIPLEQGFKAFTLRKTEELVAYGLAGELAPSLKDSSAQHVEALEYHRMMEQPDTVIIDVRNAYESAIGHFNPPVSAQDSTPPAHPHTTMPAPRRTLAGSVAGSVHWRSTKPEPNAHPRRKDGGAVLVLPLPRYLHSAALHAVAPIPSPPTRHATRDHLSLTHTHHRYSPSKVHPSPPTSM